MFSRDVKNSALRVPPAVTQVDGLPPAAVVPQTTALDDPGFGVSIRPLNARCVAISSWVP